MDSRFTSWVFKPHLRSLSLLVRAGSCCDRFSRFSPFICRADSLLRLSLTNQTSSLLRTSGLFLFYFSVALFLAFFQFLLGPLYPPISVPLNVFPSCTPSFSSSSTRAGECSYTEVVPTSSVEKSNRYKRSIGSTEFSRRERRGNIVRL